MGKKLVPVGLSNKHLHLSKEHIDQLFGKDYELTVMKDLTQPGQYAANEKVDIVGPKGKLTLRILGPARNVTQIEISVTDGFAIGITPPVRDSGKLEGTPGVKIVGPKGSVELENGVITAARHIHMHPSDAEKFDIEDNARVDVKIDGQRGLTFNNVLVRVNKEYALDMHIDIDEANAAGLKNGDFVEII